MTLSPAVSDRIAAQFAPGEFAAAAAALGSIVSVGILAAPLERVQMAALARSEGNLDELQRLVEVANHDWRDVLYWAR